MVAIVWYKMVCGAARGQCVTMVSRVVLCCVIGGLVLGQVWGNPVASEGLTLPLVSQLSPRLSTLPSRLQEPRLPLPTPQELEAIKKVAQILVMLGQQVIPAIIGDPQSSPAPSDPVPNDPVNLDKQPLTS